MKAGERVEVRPVRWDDGQLSGRGTIIAVRKVRDEVGYLIRLDADSESRPLYFGPERVIPISEESQQHMVAGE